ncbi:MAG: hypothetical protein ACI80V_002329 [Rhodothermales bacterium]|jgi:hypothetical protein
MSEGVLTRLYEIRAQTRSTIVLFALAASVAVVLIPLAYRSGTPHRWVVMVPTIAYLTIATYRLLGGFQVDRQLELEERFVRFAVSRKELLGSAQAAGKLWKLSCLVQGLTRAEAGATPDADRGDYLLRALRASTRRLLPPLTGLATPLIVAIAIAWVAVAWSNPSVRGRYLYLAVLPCLVAIGSVEWRVLSRRKEVRTSIEGLLTTVAAWGLREWTPFRDHRNLHPYRHRMYYRDRSQTG